MKKIITTHQKMVEMVFCVQSLYAFDKKKKSINTQPHMSIEWPFHYRSLHLTLNFKMNVICECIWDYYETVIHKIFPIQTFVFEN